MSTGLLGFESVQERQSGVWDYISPSRLNCWIKCPLAFRLRYLDGIKTPPNANLFVGKVVHSSMELWYRHRQLGIAIEAADITRRLVESWGRAAEEEGMTFASAAEEKVLQEQALGLVAAYLNQVPVDEARPMAVETTLEMPLIDPSTGENLGIPLLGIVDLILDESEGPMVADFKTSSRSSESLEITHEIQLSSYAWLFRQVQGRSEAGLEIRSLIKTKLPKVEIHRYPARTDAHFRRLFSVICEYLDALDSGRFNYRPGFGCGMCDFRSQCCSWAG